VHPFPFFFSVYFVPFSSTGLALSSSKPAFTASAGPHFFFFSVFSSQQGEFLRSPFLRRCFQFLFLAPFRSRVHPTWLRLVRLFSPELPRFLQAALEMGPPWTHPHQVPISASPSPGYFLADRRGSPAKHVPSPPEFRALLTLPPETGPLFSGVLALSFQIWFGVGGRRTRFSLAAPSPKFHPAGARLFGRSFFFVFFFSNTQK